MFTSKLLPKNRYYVIIVVDDTAIMLAVRIHYIRYICIIIV